MASVNKTVLLIASDGSEDMELIICSDVLRRAGIDVTIAGLQDRPEIVLARKAKLQVDALFKDVLGKKYDAVVLPGGQPGSDNLAADSRVGQVLREHEKAGAIVAAICAAPLAFVAHGICPGGVLTSYPSIKKRITDAGYLYHEDGSVYVHNNVVTSRGPGTAFDFALKLVELLVDADKAREISGAMLLIN